MMNNEERDQAIRTTAAQVSEMHSDLKLALSKISDYGKTLYGNGHPGVLSRVQAIEQRQNECPARARAIEGTAAPVRQGWVQVIISVISLMVAIGALLATMT